MFEKILVPLDGSEHSLHALEIAIQMAKKFDGKLMLIHMYSIPMFKLTPSQLHAYVLEHHKSGEKILAEGRKKAYAEGVPFETQLKEGHMVEGIVKTAREGNFDLIVMGARGQSKLKELFLGSVSHGVTLHAPCPVLIVKQLNACDLGVSNRYIDAFCGRTPKSVLARHYTDYNPERLQRIYEEANLKVLA